MVGKILWLIVLLLILLGLRFWFFYSNIPVYKDGQRFSGEFLIKDEPEIRSGRQSFSLKDHYGKQIKVVSATSPLLKFGDRVFIDGFFTKKTYKEKELISVYFPKVQILNSDNNILTNSVSWVQNKGQSYIESHMPAVPSSLLLGILFGGKHGMPDDFSEKLRVSGVMHVVAASGMNVTFVAGALLFILGSFLKRQFAVVAAGSGIVFYMFLAGFEASIVRAGIMALFAFCAGLSGRQYHGLYFLGVVFLLMLFYSPPLLTDTGFQLSFLSTLGILLLQPVFSGHVFDKKVSSKINGGRGFLLSIFSIFRDDIGTTIAAQIATMPVMLSVFGKIGILSILVNALVLWTIPVLMTFGSLALVFGVIFYPAGDLFLYLCLPFLLYFQWIISFFGGTGWVWETDWFSWHFVVGYYFILAAVLIFFFTRYKK